MVGKRLPALFVNQHINLLQNQVFPYILSFEEYEEKESEIIDELDKMLTMRVFDEQPDEEE